MLEFAKKIALNAGKRLARQYRHSRLRVGYKSRFEPVIRQDKEIESYLRKQIRKKYPKHGIIGEEGTRVEQRNGYSWILDPLDGTINYMRGFPYFSVSVAVMKNGRPFIGVVYNPLMCELFWAQSGKGAYMNGRKIGASGVSRLEQAYFSTGFRYKRGKGFIRPLKKIKNVLEKSMVVRRTGSASTDLCNVARGSFDGFFMYDTRKWDVMAGILIVKEAGGSYSAKEKNENYLDVIATNGIIHRQLKKLLKW